MSAGVAGRGSISPRSTVSRLREAALRISKCVVLACSRAYSHLVLVDVILQEANVLKKIKVSRAEGIRIRKRVGAAAFDPPLGPFDLKLIEVGLLADGVAQLLEALLGRVARREDLRKGDPVLSLVATRLVARAQNDDGIAQVLILLTIPLVRGAGRALTTRAYKRRAKGSTSARVVKKLSARYSPISSRILAFSALAASILS